ncbi:MAG: SRPBCC domain-containing protein [Solirubrobacteraceae bacterium]
MPTTRRRRTVSAPAEAVWDLVADPHHLPRWWPRASRVEDVTADRWTMVLSTAKGRAVRADYRVVASERPRRRRFAQELAGSPFERLLRSSEVEIALADAPNGTEVTMELSQQLRGASRLGGFMFRGAARRTLDEALESLERAVVG